MAEHLPVPGIQATLKFSLVGRQPQQVICDDGQSWDVREVLSEWKNPDPLDLSTTQVTHWYILKVGDRWPVVPGDENELVIQVTGYSDRPGWWVTRVGE